MAQRTEDAPYQLMLEESHWGAINALPRPSQQEKAIDFLMKHAAHTPKKTIPRKLKRLKGEHNHLWQFHIDPDYVIIYAVGEKTTPKQVLIEYIGYHPDWDKRSSGGRRIRS